MPNDYNIRDHVDELEDRLSRVERLAIDVPTHLQVQEFINKTTADKLRELKGVEEQIDDLKQIALGAIHLSVKASKIAVLGAPDSAADQVDAVVDEIELLVRKIESLD